MLLYYEVLWHEDHLKWSTRTAYIE